MERTTFSSFVPNAPCGVERFHAPLHVLLGLGVPNAPCGVERNISLSPHLQKAKVPNAPCGVERFLRHRKEG